MYKIRDQYTIQLNTELATRRLGNSSWEFSLQSVPAKFLKAEKICLTRLSIPNSFYQINSSNNKMRIDDGINPVWTFTLEEGNYQFYNLYYTLQTQLNQFFTDNAINAEIEISIYKKNNNTGKLCFQLAAASVLTTIDLLFDFDDKQHCHQVFGFDRGDTVTVTKAAQVCSTNVVNTNVIQTLYLSCDAVTPHQNNQNNQISDSLAIPVAGNSVSFQYIQMINDPIIYMRDAQQQVLESKVIRISITNEHDQDLLIQNYCNFELLLFNYSIGIDEKRFFMGIVDYFIHYEERKEQEKQLIEYFKKQQEIISDFLQNESKKK